MRNQVIFVGLRSVGACLGRARVSGFECGLVVLAPANEITRDREQKPAHAGTPEACPYSQSSHQNPQCLIYAHSPKRRDHNP